MTYYYYLSVDTIVCVRTRSGSDGIKAQVEPQLTRQTVVLVASRCSLDPVAAAPGSDTFSKIRRANEEGPPAEHLVWSA